MQNPFIIFPEEIWLIIIKALELKDAQNLFQVFPEFFSRFNKLFQHLHFAFNELRVQSDGSGNTTTSYIYKRKRTTVKFDATLVISSRWCSAVEKFAVEMNLNRTSRDFHFIMPEEKNHKALLFKDPEKIHAFENMQDLHTVRFYCPRGEQHLWNMLLASLQFLEKYGHRLKDVGLDFPEAKVSLFKTNFYIYLPPKFWESLKNVHTLFVNFKYIHFRDSYNGDPCEEFPELPNLHTLQLKDKISMWNGTNLDFFLNGYIRKGRIQTLRVIREHNYFNCEQEYMLDKECRGISHFTVHIYWKNLKRVTFESKERLLVICALWWTIKEGMDAREICFEKCKNVATVSYEVIPSMPWVKYLRIRDATFLEYRFLSGLISLENLHVISDKEEHLKMLYYKTSENRLTNVVRSYLYDEVLPREMDIFTELPSLKSLVVQENKGGKCRHFVRSQGNNPLVFTK